MSFRYICYSPPINASTTHPQSTQTIDSKLQNNQSKKNSNS